MRPRRPDAGTGTGQSLQEPDVGTGPAGTHDRRPARILALNTLAFTVCFMCWTMYGVLVTYLLIAGLYEWDPPTLGWLIGLPILSGSLIRLPIGVLTDRYGGRPVLTGLMLLAAVPLFAVSFADDTLGFVLAGLGFGFVGGSFAVGIAYTSLWFPKQRQGTALGIFGVGNAGAVITSMGAPLLLIGFTAGGSDPEGWRNLPRLYAGILVAMAVVFYALSIPKKVEGTAVTSLGQRLAPLKEMRVWRFGLYYFLVFGLFVALAQWLIPYYVNAYAMSLVMAGLIAAIYTIPAGVIRALGGWMSDRWGARSVMYGVLGAMVICALLLLPPQMDITTPGPGVSAFAPGTVTAVSPEEIVAGDRHYDLTPPIEVTGTDHTGVNLVLPVVHSWHVPAVEVGDTVVRGQILARGVTHIYFQANVWVFTLIVFVLGVVMGIGKAAVYKHIADYYPKDIGVVGGIVGVIGGLGGFAGPVIFGYLLKSSGVWTSSWAFILGISVVSLVWLHLTVRRLTHRGAPALARLIEQRGEGNGGGRSETGSPGTREVSRAPGEQHGA